MTPDRRQAGSETIAIVAGPYRATVVQTGATLQRVSHTDEELLDGFDGPVPPDGGNGQILAPWPNRLRDGRWKWRGRELRLPVDSPAKGNSASHGLVRWVAWEVLDRTTSRVELRHRLRPQAGYPFMLDLTATYEVDPVSGLSATVLAVNAGDEDAPVALGAHPYLRPPGGGPIDQARLRVPASTRVLTDAWGIPEQTEAVQDTPFDLRLGPPLGQLRVNHAFSGLTHVNGRVHVDLTGREGRTVSLWAGPSCRWLQVFTGDTLRHPRRRRSVAVEPMTAPAGALASGAGLTVLTPGAATELLWGLSLADPT